MNRPQSFLGKYGFDLLIVMAAVESALETAVRLDQPGTTLWFGVPAVALVVLTLLGRHRFPFAAPAALWLLSAALSFTDGMLIVTPVGVSVAGMVAALLLGNLRGRVRAGAGLLIVLSCATIIVLNDPRRTAREFVFIPALFLIGWIAGFLLRARDEQREAADERAIRAEQDREATARVAVAEERTRIARELHDVVAHAVSVIVLQVGAVRHRMPDTYAEERDALKSVEQAGRTALPEMRQLLGAMRHDGDDLELLPHPGLDELDSLLDHVRGAGLAVRLQIHGRPFPLPPGIDLSAYRILQEGLTNTLKHAGASEAEVNVDYCTTELNIEVRDNGHGGGSVHDGPGHGLLGIGERVKIYGGEMTASAGSSGFVLRARLPVNGYRS